MPKMKQSGYRESKEMESVYGRLQDSHKIIAELVDHLRCGYNIDPGSEEAFWDDTLRLIQKYEHITGE